MDRDAFEAEVLGLASDGVKLSTANVAARTRLPLRKVETWLDDMVLHGHLDSDVDEQEAIVVYRVKGLSVGPSRARVAVEEARRSVESSIARKAGEVVVKQAGERAKRAILTTRPGERSVVWGLGLGLVFGPLGLAYAAPWVVVIVSFLCYGLAASIPIIRSIFGYLLPFLHIGFAVAGGLYAWRFNREGKRAPILPPEEHEPPKLGR